jgi:hypothetical protein
MKIIAPLFLCISLLNACYAPRYVYSPSTQNIPLVTKKNDVELSAFYAGAVNAFKDKGSYIRGFDIHAAWAVSHHFAVMVNGSARWEKNGSNDTYFRGDSSLLSYKRNFTEVAAGYYAASKKNNKMLFQVFGGAALGPSRIFDDYISNSVHENKYHYSRVSSFFIQPALLYSPFKVLSTALASRFSAVVFSRVRTNYSADQLKNYLLDSIAISPVFFWEPAVSYTFAFKKLPVKFAVEGSFTILLNHRFIEHRNANVGVGVTYDFLKRKK